MGDAEIERSTKKSEAALGGSSSGFMCEPAFPGILPLLFLRRSFAWSTAGDRLRCRSVGWVEEEVGAAAGAFI